MIDMNPEITQQLLVTFIRDTFATAGFVDAVIGISGGVDSATSAALTVRALGAEHVYPVLLPYGALNTQGVIDGMSVVESFHIPLNHVTRIDIQPPANELIKHVKEMTLEQVRKGNVMARVRMIYLFDQAKKRRALVVGTENKSEHYLGYFTRFGDEASDLEPLRNLYKSQVYQLAKHLGLPEILLTKAPTAGLWESQTDESEFGFTYKQADEILSMTIDQKKTVDEVVAAGVDRRVVDLVMGRVAANNFKHHLPHIPLVVD